MLMFVIQHQPHRAGTDLRRELVACLLAHGSTFSRVGASGKPGAVQAERIQGDAWGVRSSSRSVRSETPAFPSMNAILRRVFVHPDLRGIVADGHARCAGRNK